MTITVTMCSTDCTVAAHHLRHFTSHTVTAVSLQIFFMDITQDLPGNDSAESALGKLGEYLTVR